MKAGQAAACLLGRHRLGNFRSDVDKSTLSIKYFSCFLNLRGAYDHLRETARTRLRLRAIEHASRNAQAPVAFIEIHSTKLRVVDTAAFDAKRTDDLMRAFDDPKGVALCLRKDLGKLLELTIDCHRDVLLEQLLYPGRGEFSIDARPQRSDRAVIRCLV